MDGSAGMPSSEADDRDWDGSDMPAAALPKTNVRLIFTRGPSQRTYVQLVEVAVRDVESRLYDVILLAWGRSRFALELTFVIAIDEGGALLGNTEGLALYAAHTQQEAREDLYGALTERDGEAA